MEILLRADIAKLGRRGEIVKVSTGYGRNYLIPHGLAMKVDPGNVAQIDQEIRCHHDAMIAEHIAEHHLSDTLNAVKRIVSGSTVYDIR